MHLEISWDKYQENTPPPKKKKKIKYMQLETGKLLVDNAKRRQ